jgi:SSS family solute:Na+ symporter
VFIAAVVSEALTILVYNLNIISFLWLNVIGALLVIALSVVLQPILPRNKKVKSLA